MKHKFKESVLFFVVFLSSILLITVYTGFDIGMYSADDNANQWGPVIEQTFDTIFEEGYYPTIDFYQSKGFICIDEGVYGILNPIMFFSYLISKFVLSRAIDTISLYVVMCFALGNGVQYLLLKKFGFSTKIAVLTVLLLASSMPFIYFGYWYNVMNIYLMVPILLLSMLYMDKGRLGYYMSGVVLAFGLQLGHVQYAFYLYIIFGFVSIVLVLFYDRKLFIKVLSNLGIAILLSSPNLLAMLVANERRSLTNSTSSIFIMAMGPFEQLEYSIIPKMFLEVNYFGGPYSDLVMRNNSYKNVFSPLYLVGYVSLLILILIRLSDFIKKNKNLKIKQFEFIIRDKISFYKREKNCSIVFMSGIILSSYFFINYAMGMDGIVANIIYYIPIINSFRFALKAVFVYIPLLVIPAAYMIHILFIKYKDNKIKHVLMAFLIGYCALGIMNNHDTLVNDINPWMGQVGAYSVFETAECTEIKMEENQIRKDEYRMLSFLSDKSFNDRSMSENNLSEDFINTRNYPTIVESYSLGGYDVAGEKDTFDSCDAIMHEDVFVFERMRGVSGNDVVNKSYDQEYFERLEDQIKSNSIKYVVIQKNDEALEEIIKLIEQMETVSIISRKDYDEYNIILELDGIRPLCSNGDYKSFPLMNDMGRLRANVDNSKNIYLSFMYREEMEGTLISEAGQQYKLSLSADQDGHIIVQNDTGLPGEIRITYHNRLHTILIVFAILITIISFIFGVELFRFSINSE